MILPDTVSRAMLASSLFMKVTNPKPFDPLSLKMISASIMSPNPWEMESEAKEAYDNRNPQSLL